jgi:hypothetical protein
MADELTPKEMLEHIRRWRKERDGHYSAGDRQLADLFKNAETHLSRLIGVSASGDSPGSKAAVNATNREKRESGTPGSQYDARPVEPRGVENQPKTFEDAKDAFEEAHQKFKDAVGVDRDA